MQGSEQKYLKVTCLKDPKGAADGDIYTDRPPRLSLTRGQKGEGIRRELGMEGETECWKEFAWPMSLAPSWEGASKSTQFPK